MWQELTCVVGSDNLEEMEEALLKMGALSVRFEAANEQPLFREDLDDDRFWDCTKVVAMFDREINMSSLVESIKRKGPVFQSVGFHWDNLDERDWVRLTQEQFAPQKIANKLWVCPEGMQVDEGDYVLKINPGLAFGTGKHETTQLCLEWLCQNDVVGSDIIDYGCGSGILSLAALVLGASTLYALDHDDQALIATKANAKLNPISKGQCLEVMFPDALSADVKVPLVVANILARPLRNLIQEFVKHLTSDGLLIMSGLMQEDIDEMRLVYSEYFDEVNVKIKEDWVLMVWKRQ